MIPDTIQCFSQMLTQDRTLAIITKFEAEIRQIRLYDTSSTTQHIFLIFKDIDAIKSCLTSDKFNKETVEILSMAPNIELINDYPCIKQIFKDPELICITLNVEDYSLSTICIKI